MSERQAEFGPDVTFALVTFSDPKYLRAYRQRTGWDFPILTDIDRSIYQMFGYGRGSVWRVYGWKVVKRYATLLRSGRIGRMEKATEDTLQLGGDVVIAPDGSVQWIYRGAGPDDRPSVDDIISQTQQARESAQNR